MSLTCSTSSGNLAKSTCVFDPGQVILGYTTPNNTGMTFADAIDKTKWEEKMFLTESERWHILFPAYPLTVEPMTAEMTEVTGNTNKKSFKKGLGGYTFTYESLSPCDRDALETLHNKSFYWYSGTETTILGDKTATNFIPTPVLISVSEMQAPADNNSNWLTVVQVSFQNKTGNYSHSIDAQSYDWSPQDVDGVTNVTISNASGDISDTEVIFTVNKSCGLAEISDIGVTEFDNFVVNDGTANLTISAITNVGNVYTLTVAGLTAVPTTIALKSAESQTLPKYETTAVATFTPQA
jgi:hypothetical protein